MSRINSYPETSKSSLSSDDYLVVDGDTNGTRRIKVREVAVFPDASLSKEGVAADAKAVGDKLMSQKSISPFIDSDYRVDLDNVTIQGHYKLLSNTSDHTITYYNLPPEIPNDPSNNEPYDGYYVLKVEKYHIPDTSNRQIMQTCFDAYRTTGQKVKIYYRIKGSISWGPWHRLLRANDIDSTLSIEGAPADAKAVSDALNIVGEKVDGGLALIDKKVDSVLFDNVGSMVEVAETYFIEGYKGYGTHFDYQMKKRTGLFHYSYPFYRYNEIGSRPYNNKKRAIGLTPITNCAELITTLLKGIRFENSRYAHKNEVIRYLNDFVMTDVFKAYFSSWPNFFWDSRVSYSVGDKVVHNHKGWKSTSNDNTSEPGKDNLKWAEMTGGLRTQDPRADYFNSKFASDGEDELVLYDEIYDYYHNNLIVYLNALKEAGTPFSYDEIADDEMKLAFVSFVYANTRCIHETEDEYDNPIRNYFDKINNKISPWAWYSDAIAVSGIDRRDYMGVRTLAGYADQRGFLQPMNGNGPIIAAGDIAFTGTAPDDDSNSNETGISINDLGHVMFVLHVDAFTRKVEVLESWRANKYIQNASGGIGIRTSIYNFDDIAFYATFPTGNQKHTIQKIYREDVDIHASAGRQTESILVLTQTDALVNLEKGIYTFIIEGTFNLNVLPYISYNVREKTEEATYTWNFSHAKFLVNEFGNKTKLIRTIYVVEKDSSNISRGNVYIGLDVQESCHISKITVVKGYIGADFDAY